MGQTGLDQTDGGRGGRHLVVFRPGDGSGDRRKGSAGAAFIPLRFGEVKPAGLDPRADAVRDLEQGFAGCLDELCHEAAVIFSAKAETGRERRTTAMRIATRGGNGETEGKLALRADDVGLPDRNTHWRWPRPKLMSSTLWERGTQTAISHLFSPIAL